MWDHGMSYPMEEEWVGLLGIDGLLEWVEARLM